MSVCHGYSLQAVCGLPSLGRGLGNGATGGAVSFTEMPDHLVCDCPQNWPPQGN